MTRKPLIAGILDLLIGGPIVVFALVFLVGGIMSLNYEGDGSIFVFIAIIVAIMGVPPTIGGIYALQKKRWPVALIGSIIAALVAMMMLAAWARALFQTSSLPGAAAVCGAIMGLGMGTVATIFVVLSKEEFT